MNHYAEAIDILMGGECDWQALAKDYAKRHPAQFIRAHKAVQLGGWQGECLALLQANKKVAAIKRCREMTGRGLKEAKEAVEALA
ncbi:hypothetical protein EQG41_18090 [Billgrantia azerbaijanica]|nr:hypothetical protein EQG41_18090 [Halomonas azerbaijanica]